VVDLEEKASIYAISDLFLHARSLGESFGMAIVEAMQVGLPALAWYGGRDTNHRTHLEDFNLLYRNKEELWRLLEGFRSKMLTGRDLSTRLRSYAERFRPDNLIESYLEVVFRIKQ
jgi:glycosyltransferase involved in cell wall biosynthesis